MGAEQNDCDGESREEHLDDRRHERNRMFRHARNSIGRIGGGWDDVEMKLGKHRIEALSDGIFSIAMTLLVLDIKVPGEVSPGKLGHAVALQGHELISFVITFLIASTFWVAQHRVFDLLEEIGTESLVLTFVTLGFVSVLPFTTSMWGHHIAEPLAFFLYFANQFGIALPMALKLEIAMRRGQVRHTMASDMSRLRLWLLCGVMATAMIATQMLPLKYMGVALIVPAVAARVLRARQKKKWERLEAGTVALEG